jgi:putative transposase
MLCALIGNRRLDLGIAYDLPPEIALTYFLDPPRKYAREDDAEEQVHGRADRRHPARTGGRCAAADLARRYGISDQTLYNWKKKYGGLDVSDAKRLRQLEDEKSRLKRLVADQALDNVILRELNPKPQAAPQTGFAAVLPNPSGPTKL